MTRGRPYAIGVALLVKAGEIAQRLGVPVADFLDACVQNAAMGAVATRQTKEQFLSACAAAFDHTVSLSASVEEGNAP